MEKLIKKLVEHSWHSQNLTEHFQLFVSIRCTQNQNAWSKILAYNPDNTGDEEPEMGELGAYVNLGTEEQDSPCKAQFILARYYRYASSRINHAYYNN